MMRPWFWRSTTLRQQFQAENDVVTRTASQLICEINLYREKIEKAGGAKITATGLAHQYNIDASIAESQETISENFCDVAMTLWKRVFTIPEALEIIRSTDNKYGLHGPFDSLAKMQVVLQKSPNNERMVWAFASVADTFENGMLRDTGVRVLAGTRPGDGGKGVVDEYLFKREILDWILGTWMLDGQGFTSLEAVGLLKTCSSH